jgi:hypothetical protein
MIDLRQVGIPQCSGKLTWFYITHKAATRVDVVSMYRLVGYVRANENHERSRQLR